LCRYGGASPWFRLFGLAAPTQRQQLYEREDDREGDSGRAEAAGRFHEQPEFRLGGSEHCPPHRDVDVLAERADAHHHGADRPGEDGDEQVVEFPGERSADEADADGRRERGVRLGIRQGHAKNGGAHRDARDEPGDGVDEHPRGPRDFGCDGAGDDGDRTDGDGEHRFLDAAHEPRGVRRAEERTWREPDQHHGGPFEVDSEQAHE